MPAGHSCDQQRRASAALSSALPLLPAPARPWHNLTRHRDAALGTAAIVPDDTTTLQQALKVALTKCLTFCSDGQRKLKTHPYSAPAAHSLATVESYERQPGTTNMQAAATPSTPHSPVLVSYSWCGFPLCPAPPSADSPVHASRSSARPPQAQAYPARPTHLLRSATLPHPVVARTAEHTCTPRLT